MSSELAIAVRHLSKCYHIYSKPSDRFKQFVLPKFFRGSEKQFFNEFWALKDVSFDVRKGESVGILGRNGSGKSTLLQLITGTLEPTSGEVAVSGKISALLELGAGFNPEFTGRENVYLGGALQGWSLEETKEKYARIAEFADIGDFLEMPVKTYSSGMYARLAFGAAIHSDPEILIVDEILAVGDAAFQSKCLKRLYAMMDGGVSVLMVSHDAYQIRSVCQKAVVLNSGKQVFYGSAARGMDEYIAILAEAVDEPLIAESQGNDESIEVVTPEQSFFITIHNVVFSAKGGASTDIIRSGDAVEVSFEYTIHGKYEGDLSFVINLYREDGVYVFGTTTAMQGIAPFDSKRAARVTVSFPSLRLVSGVYKWRVAVNDGRGLHIISEAVSVCQFRVEDEFVAVGIVDIEHVWAVTELGNP